MYTVPRGAGFSVSDIEIFGVPIRHGSQIAQCLTVGFDVLAEDAGRAPAPLPGRARAMRPTDGSHSFITVPLAQPDDPRYEPLFPDTPRDPAEPILDDRDIQGNALAGFNKNHQWIIGFDIVDPARARLWLEARSHTLSTTLEVAEHNQRYRAYRARRAPRPAPAAWFNLAFSFAGLRELRDDAAELPSRAFRQGLAGRGLLRAGGREPHLLAILAADEAPMLPSVLGAVDEIARRAGDWGLRVVFHEIGANDLGGADHFGFKDGISQPGIRGRLSHPRHDPLTPREVVLGKSHPSYGDPHGPEYARPGQMLVWPGEFVLGYPRQSPHHPREPAPGHPVTPAWSRNGSYLVYLRLKQDVAAFERAVAAAAAARGVSPDEAAALMVGRRRDGRPLVAVKAMHDNHFLYADTAEPMATSSRRVVPRVPGDALGARCPFTAHIRKVNPRDDTTEEGAIPATLRRRILRRGIPYRRGDDDRGLLFVSYQASIEEQFEQLVGGWAMGAERPSGPGGVDAILGRLGEPGHFIELVAGGYFFSPAISSVRLLAR